MALFTTTATTPTSYKKVTGDLQTTRNYASYIDSYADKLIDEMPGEIDAEQFMQLFAESSMSKNTDIEQTRVSSNGQAVISEDGTELTYLTKGQGWKMTWTALQYRIAMKYTLEAMEEDNYQYGVNDVRDVADAMKRALKYGLIDWIDRGFGDSGAPGIAIDGKYLFDDARTSPLAGVSQWSNLESTAVISENSLFTAKINADDMIAHNGDRWPFEIKRIFVPQSREQELTKLLGTEKEVDNAMNTINTVYKMVPFQVLRELTTDCIIYEQGPVGKSNCLKDPEFNGLQLRWRVAPQKLDLSFTDTTVRGFQYRARWALGLRYPYAMRAGKNS